MKELYVVWAGAGVREDYGIDEDVLIFDVCESEDTAKEKYSALRTEYYKNPKAFAKKHSPENRYRKWGDSEYDYFFFDVKKITTGQVNLITRCCYVE